VSSLLVYGLLALAVLASAAGLYAKVHHDGYAEGEGVVQGRWDAANRTAQAQADALRQQRAAEGQKSSAALQQAEAEADAANDRWIQARKEARNARIPLAVCPGQPQPSATAVAGTTPQLLVLRLSYEFLREYDTAWTGQDGQPVFSDPPRPPETELAAASPVTLPDALETHAENARRCSEHRRQLDKLTALIKSLQEK